MKVLQNPWLLSSKHNVSVLVLVRRRCCCRFSIFICSCVLDFASVAVVVIVVVVVVVVLVVAVQAWFVLLLLCSSLGFALASSRFVRRGSHHTPTPPSCRVVSCRVIGVETQKHLDQTEPGSCRTFSSLSKRHDGSLVMTSVRTDHS